MKRRRFIQAALLTVPAAATAATGARLYGAPGSIAPTAESMASKKLLLPLSKSGMPPQFWAEIQSITSVIQNVIESPSEGELFSASPAAYLAKHGLDSSEATLQEESIKIIEILTRPDVKRDLAAKDYSSLMNRLKSSGALINFDSTNLQRQLEVILTNNAEEIRHILAERIANSPEAEREVFLRIMDGDGSPASEDDLAITYNLISASIEESPLSIVIVTIALLAVTVAVDILLWVAVAAWVTVYETETQSSASAGMGKLSKIDPDLSTNYERINRIGVITGDKQIIEQNTRDLILLETSAVVNAMRNSGILNITAKKCDEIIETMTAYNYKVLGL